MTFREKIVKLRKMKGLTQDEFASAVGVSRQAVYKWESGQSYPEVAKLIEIKLLFNISIDDLLDETYEVIVPEKKKKRRISAEEKRRIESEVRAEEDVEESVDEVKEELVPVVMEPASEPVKATTPEIKEEPAAEEKRGFFAKLFGRK